MDDYISKPVMPEYLEEVLKRWVGEDRMIYRKGGGNVLFFDDGADEKNTEMEVDNDIGSEDESLNKDVLNSLKEMLGGAFSVVIEKYITTSNELIANMEKAIEGNELEELSKIAHSLKSSSAQVGALNIANLCKFLENKPLSKDITKVKSAYKSIKDDYKIVVQELKQSN